ncbi:MBL fold metallo-hydrolase [Kordiimonas sp.]|uniref:MBL fold metallo-hydrolase n=1 Tax=Kordiimonas sp. TaxID=1970157 RepID=UPI003A941F56
MGPEFIQDYRAPYGDAEKLSPLVTRVLCNNPSPFTYTGTGTYLVGRKQLAVIDPGPDMQAHGEAILKATGNRKVTHILVTHTHIDHSPLAAWLSDHTGAPILAFGKHGAGRKGGLAGEDVEAGADWDFNYDELLRDGESVKGDGWTLRAHHTPGHTANHLCFMLEEERALFVGDHVMGWATTVIAPPDGDMRDYLASLKKVINLEPDRLYPTHGPFIDSPKSFVRGIITHRRMREGQILKHLEAGPMNIDMMVERMYKSIDKRLYPAAARSVLGHLIALVDEKRVKCVGKANLYAQYELEQ